MQFGRVLAIAIIALALHGKLAWAQPAPAAPSVGPPASPPATPAPPAAESPGAAPASPAAEPEPPSALALAKEGRRLLKAKETAAAVAKLKESVDKATQEKLDPELRASLYYIYGLALLRADQEDLALQQLETSVTLDPKDPEVRVTLAAQLLAADKPARAKAEAELALTMGLTDKDDVETARKVIKDAKSQLLQERLTVNASVAVGYDSDVLQGGPIISIANKSLRTQRATATLAGSGGLRGALKTADANVIIGNYTTASPPTVEWDLPISLDFDLTGRLFSKSKVELWLGYRFQQTLMSSIAFDHDDYNFQEHDVPLRLEIKPAEWLFLRFKAEGFVNFTGLKAFSPYQGGLNAGVEAWFIESRRWKTRLAYQHQLRRSFDQGSIAYLNGDRDEGKLVQELKLRGKQIKVRGSLGYRFRSDRAGVFTTTQDFDLDTALTMQAPSKPNNCAPLMPLQSCTYPVLISVPSTGKNEVKLGSYSYSAPLTYFSHELSTRWTVSVPGGRSGAVELLANVSWEYFTFPEAYTATFAQLLTPTTDMDPGNWPVNPRAAFSMPSQQRTDNLITLSAGVTKKLPLGLSLELSYSFYKNISTIANYVDNRNYDKHVVQLGGSYTY